MNNPLWTWNRDAISPEDKFWWCDKCEKRFNEPTTYYSGVEAVGYYCDDCIEKIEDEEEITK